MQAYTRIYSQSADCRIKHPPSSAVPPIRGISGGKWNKNKKFPIQGEAQAWVKIGWMRVRWRGWYGEMKRKGDRRTKRKKEKRSKRDLEEVLIVFPWCFEEDSGLKASEQKAVGVPIVLATKPDPLAHKNTHARARSHAHTVFHLESDISWEECRGEGGGGGEKGLIEIRRH